MVAQQSTWRKAFRAALAYAGTTARAFAHENEITEGHLYQVLRGVRQSPPLAAKINAFIAEHTPRGRRAA